MAQVEVEDKPKGVAKNLRAKSAHATLRPLVLAFQEHGCWRMESDQGGEAGRRRHCRLSRGGGRWGEVEKRRRIYVRQKISKLDLTRTLFFCTSALASHRSWNGPILCFLLFSQFQSCQLIRARTLWTTNWKSFLISIIEMPNRHYHRGSVSVLFVYLLPRSFPRRFSSANPLFTFPFFRCFELLLLYSRARLLLPLIAFRRLTIITVAR